ncbi:unnamed protein product [Prunus armeniaca]
MAISRESSYCADSWDARTWGNSGWTKGEPFLSKNIRPQLGQKALHQFRCNRTSQPHPIPQDQPLALLPEPPTVLPYRPRRMDPNPFPPPARGRRGGRGYPSQKSSRAGSIAGGTTLGTSSCVVFRDVIQEGIAAGRLKLAEKSPSVTTDPFPQPQVNMVNLNWPEQKRSRPTTKASSSRGRMVSRETIERPKTTISAGVVLCSKCKCEAELEVVLDRQSQPIPSVFGRIGTSSRDRARRKEYPKPTQHSRRMTEQPKKEISIKMPGNEKPLAAIIEGRWYAVGKNGKPTMELTRTQKRRVQRQYCMFLKNKSDAQAPPETEQKRERSGNTFPDRTSNPATENVESWISNNQFKPSQIQGESEPIPIEGPEDWTERNEEEQLDYEPSADDQNALLETGEQEDWTEGFGDEHMEYDGELDAETEPFGAELENLLQGDLDINTVFILPEKFRAAEGEESTLEGDVFSQESFECRLAEAEETT